MPGLDGIFPPKGFVYHFIHFTKEATEVHKGQRSHIETKQAEAGIWCEGLSSSSPKLFAYWEEEEKIKGG